MNRAPIEFFWQGTPPRSTAQTRRHTRSGASYRTAANARALATLRAVLERHAPARPLDGPLYVRITFTFPGKRLAYKTTRPDADNLAKDFLDAMAKEGYFHDDGQITMLFVAKFTGILPGIHLRLTPLTEPGLAPIIP